MTVVVPYDPAEDWAEALPLVQDAGERPIYPVDALGPVLAGAASAIVDATQCPVEIAAQSVLAVATLAVQAHADVCTPAGQRRPISLYLITVAGSGERKSAADSLALAPVRKAEDRAGESYRDEWGRHSNALDAWQAERRKICSDKKTGQQAKQEALDGLGPEPRPPLRPELTVADVTIEGMVKGLVDSQPTRGLFTPEGGVFAAGVAMSDDNRLKTAATLSGLWDDGRADRHRAGEGPLQIVGRRLTIHVLIQPDASRRLLAANDLIDQGLISRLLIAAPASNAGTRLFRKSPQNDARLIAYNRTIERWLGCSPPTIDGRNQADPRVLQFDPDAEELWIRFHDHIEQQLGVNGTLEPIKALGSKMAEHVARIAGVLTLMTEADAVSVPAQAVRDACGLADFYVAEALRLNAEAKVSADMARAEKLRKWLIDTWTETLISLPDALQRGPNALRTKAMMERCFEILESHCWLMGVGPSTINGQTRELCWRVNRGRGK